VKIWNFSYYIDDGHNLLYKELRRLFKKESYRYDVFCYVAAATGKRSISRCIKSGKFVDDTALRDLAEDFSEKDRALIEIAYQLTHMYNLLGYVDPNKLMHFRYVNLADLFGYLNKGSRKVALTAMYHVYVTNGPE
jgi:hypothetical protein